MAIPATVHAEVIDISIDQPKPSDVFLVDTNVWFWFAYSKSSLFPSSSSSLYSAYLKRALEVGATLYVSGLSQSELLHIIERKELDLSGVGRNLKNFRHNHPHLRPIVVEEAVAAWGIVESTAQIIDLNVNKSLTDRVLIRLQQCALDGYDLIAAEAMFEHGIPQVLTDDGDFACLLDVSLFTANRNVIQTANQQNKLTRR